MVVSDCYYPIFLLVLVLDYLLSCYQYLDIVIVNLWYTLRLDFFVQCLLICTKQMTKILTKIYYGEWGYLFFNLILYRSSCHRRKGYTLKIELNVLCHLCFSGKMLVIIGILGGLNVRMSYRWIFSLQIAFCLLNNL